LRGAEERQGTVEDSAVHDFGLGGYYTQAGEEVAGADSSDNLRLRGTGMVKSPVTVCNESTSRCADGEHWTARCDVRVHPEVVKHGVFTTWLQRWRIVGKTIW